MFAFITKYFSTKNKTMAGAEEIQNQGSGKHKPKKSGGEEIPHKKKIHESPFVKYGFFSQLVDPTPPIEENQENNSQNKNETT